MRTVSWAPSAPQHVLRKHRADGQGERSDSRAQTGHLPLQEELDPEGIPQFGLVAEEVAKVNPDLVARDDKGKIYTCATRQ